MFIKQYELWQTCNNNCVFCFNKGFAQKLEPEKQEKSLRFVIQDIDRVVSEHKELSIELIGGDFFQGQLSTPVVKELFYQLIYKLKNLGDSGLIKQVCLFATLTIGEQEDLYKVLDILTSNQKTPFEVWVSTSYDAKGRFHNNDMLNNWKKHMIKMSSIPSVYKNTTIIFTQAFLDSVLSGDFNFIDFQDKYKTTLFFKHPLPLLINSYYTDGEKDHKKVYNLAKRDCILKTPWFMPRREDALKVMSIMNECNILDRLMGLDYRADDLDSKFDENGFIKTVRDKENNIESLDEEKNKCGHLLTYMCYSNSDKCLLCDKESLDV